MKYGLSEAELDTIRAYLSQVPDIRQAVLFGSRALGTFKEASDIDIALKGEGVDIFTCGRLKSRLEDETTIPYFFDFVAYDSLANEALLRHIDTKGVCIYGEDRGVGEWKECQLGDVSLINPTESLRKGQLAKKISMEVLQPFTKKPSSFSFEEYNGGMKFRNGDTIVARITPCLENGKTAFIDILDEDEVGFGSTEYIVIREKKGISDKHFLYYFTISSTFRDVAILSMTGSSGRQRVQTEVIKQHIFEIPELEEQRAIASVLSSLDDKIDLLHRQNKTLEAMAETLFRQWFVEEAEEGWEEKPLSDFVKVIDNRGKTPPYQEIPTLYPIIEVNALTGKNRLVDYSVIKKYVTEKIFNTWFRGHPKKFDSLVSTVGSIGEISMFLIEKGSIAQNVIALSSINISPIYIFEALKNLKDEIKELDIGSVQPSIKVPHLLSIRITVPPIEKIELFDFKVKKFLEKMVLNYNQIQTLEKLRDTLLPKLMSGEVRVAFNP